MTHPESSVPPPDAPPPALDEPIPAQGKWMAFTAAFLGWMFDGMEMGLFPLVGRPALRELLMSDAVGQNVDKAIGSWFGIIIAAFLLGAAGGGILFGWLGDRIGRVRAMVWSVLCYSVFSGLCAVVNAPWQFMVLRFLAALGMGGEWALGVSLVMEVWPGKSRPVLAGLIGAAANVGFLLVGFLGLGLARFMIGVQGFLAAFLPQGWVDALMANNGWRLLCIIGAVPALLTFFIRLFVPESERWKHATKTSPKTHVRDIFAPGILRHTVLGACLAGLALLGTWGSVQWIPAWTGKLLDDEEKAKAAAASQKADTAATPDSVTAEKPAKDEKARKEEESRKKSRKAEAMSWAQIWMSVGAIIGPLIVALLAERFNRRRAYFGLCIASFAVCQFMFRSPQSYGGVFLFLSFLANGLTASFYGWLPLYLPELFPTRMRATGSGFSFNIGRVFAASGTLVSGQLLGAFDGDYARMCSWITLIYIVGMIIIWLGPETKGKPLPE
jgi:SHS family sialic acid transporter-like MFS transporter